MLLRYISLVLFTGICCECAAQAPEAAEIKNNKIKKITSRYKAADGTETFVATYYYNENGDDTAYYEGDVRKYYKVLGYNRKLQLLTIAKYFPSGSLMDSTKFIYLPDGSFSSVNADAQFGLKTRESFDKKGHLLSISIPDGTVVKYVYNNKGQMTSTYAVAKKGEKVTPTVYTYDAKGKMIASTNKSAINSKTTYQYDKNGLLKKRIVTSTDESGEKKTTLVEYEYGY